MNEGKPLFKVVVLKSTRKSIEKMPKQERKKLALLLFDLEEYGAIRKEWPNFSSLGGNKYHCHLSYKWVACWTWEKDSIVIEVYYAGSREKAPY